MADAGAALYGRAWVDHPPPKWSKRIPDGPPLEGSRDIATWDALRPEDHERIKADAKDRAKEVMERWEARR